jgi:hypothetical protein
MSDAKSDPLPTFIVLQTMEIACKNGCKIRAFGMSRLGSKLMVWGLTSDEISAVHGASEMTIRDTTFYVAVDICVPIDGSIAR